jgi:hypothetical protein
MKFYQNTFLRQSPVFRGHFLFGLGAVGLRHNERDVFNNIFVQKRGIPGAGFVAIKEAGHLREGANVLWGVDDGPSAKDVFAKFRTSPLFEQSKHSYEQGWTTHDRFVDPKLMHLPNDANAASDLRLQPDSPAIDAGLVVPSEWPDPLRDADKGQPDIGAIPRGVEPWTVGVDGRISIFSGRPMHRSGN